MERLNNGDFVSRRKRKTTTTSTRAKKKKPTPNTSYDVKLAYLSSLPHELLVVIVARVPILYYRTLSLVSKSFQSMVASPELYKVRSLLGLTECCLYVCLRFGLAPYKWYNLASKSNSSGGGYALGRVPVPNDDSWCRESMSKSDLVAVGSHIYNIGVAPIKSFQPQQKNSGSGVSILDCKSHTWCKEAPSMPVEVHSLSLSAMVHDRKIYVLGRRYNHDGSRKSLVQVFNTDRQTWDLPFCGLGIEATHPCIIGCLKSYCQIDNVMYSLSREGALRWYDTGNTMWRDLNGLVGLPKLSGPLDSYNFKLTGYGSGKMMVFWIGDFSQHSPMQTLYCAEIALERRNGDCWGKLVWYGGVLSTFALNEVNLLSVTL